MYAWAFDCVSVTNHSVNFYMKTRTSSAIAMLGLSACATARPTASTDFAERVVQTARSAGFKLGSSTIHLGAKAESLPAGCFQASSRGFECYRGGQPERRLLRVDELGIVKSITVYRQSGSVDFTCRVFRAVEASITEIGGKQPTALEGKCDCENPTGCAGGEEAHREWTFENARLVFISTRNPERLIAPDGSALGELTLDIKILPDKDNNPPGEE